MTLRRALWASPLAVSVAVLAHVVAFGFLHAPGAGHATGLLSILALTLVLGLFGAFGEGLTGRSRRAIATEPRCVYAPLVLATAGAAAFGLIEFSEGHFALPAFFVALSASLPIAYLVLRGARTARSIARNAGSRVAVLIDRSAGTLAPTAIVSATHVATFTSFLAGGASRGRAPPALV